MVGYQAIGLSFVFLLCKAQEWQCNIFKEEYCSLSNGAVLMIDAKITGPTECQNACYEKSRCTQFTFFRGDKSKCILFKTCRKPMSSCSNCISGPAYPRVGNCASQDQQRGGRPKTKTGRSSRRQGAKQIQEVEAETKRKDQDESPTADYYDDDFERYDDDDQDMKDNEAEGRKRDAQESDDDDDENEVNIDDGLLDDVFEDLPDNKNKPLPKPTRTTPTKPRNSNAGNCPSCGGSYYCLMGGSNTNGPVSKVSVMNVGTYSVPSRQLISPFPSFMTLGNGNTFSTYSNNALHTCTPGYQVSRFGFHHGRIQSSYVSGSCNEYNFRTGQWSSLGGRMTQFRNGGSTLTVGSYVMSIGGHDPFGSPLSSVEIFDPRRPHIGWHDVPQWSYPRAAKDQCTVVTKDHKLGSQVMVMGGVGEEYSVMKLVLSTNKWFSVPPMNHPRTQHSCTSITLNGRPGVVVSGGMDTNRSNTSSVEFFDMNTNKWINLPSLSRGRRGHTMTNIDGKMAVAGGASTGFRGEDEFLGDVEVFDGRRWRTAAYRMDQPRNGANLIKIPTRSFFTG